MNNWFLIIGLAGGLYAVFVFVHFVIDWVFQTHYEAMNKHNNTKIRAKHCLIYTAPFIPLMYVLGISPLWIAICAVVLFLSHFGEDTYLPVYWWAKHIRRHPLVTEKGLEGFKEMFGTPLGALLAIAIDQIVHLIFLWVPVIVCLLGL